MDIKALQELQGAYDLACGLVNRSLVKIILFAQNDGSVPLSAFDKALERAKEARAILGQLETWIVDNSPDKEV
jgi:hypothetical protein